MEADSISTEQATGYDLLDDCWQAVATGFLEPRLCDKRRRFEPGHLLENDSLVAKVTRLRSGDMVVPPLVTEANAQQVWRLNVATGELKQLAFGKLEWGTSCTPDGKWVVYEESDSVPHIFRVPVDGGTPVELAHANVSEPTVSPDGALVAYGRFDGQEPAQSQSSWCSDWKAAHPYRRSMCLRHMLGSDSGGRRMGAPSPTCTTHTTGNTQNVHAAPGWGRSRAVDPLQFGAK